MIIFLHGKLCTSEVYKFNCFRNIRKLCYSSCLFKFTDDKLSSLQTQLPNYQNKFPSDIKRVSLDHSYYRKGGNIISRVRKVGDSPLLYRKGNKGPLGNVPTYDS